MKIERSMLVALLLAVLATAIGIVLSYVIKWFPVQASTQAKETDTFYHVLVIASIPIFVIVVTVILYSVWRFRMRPGQEMMDGPPIHGNTRLEIIWTTLPAILLLGLVAYSFVVLHNNEKKPAKEINVGVIGQQFFWTYEYPPAITGGAPLKSTQLYVPEGESVKFDMVSRDVIHAFWIPAFRIQEDVVPGITTHWRATPDRLGNYPVVCNLLCGLGHALMRSTVHVVSEEAFHAWIRTQVASQTSASTGDGLATSGATG